ncbi:hypothetical protein H7X46_22515 [Pseudonocardia sp. C8]|uniref:hypothetical protein n=1 Tax=Pseudonocardia sp. C8 TaxID=2762759 RepID=UPI001642C152|nr:hypothetical protein [Pseudonocardia sp. C8]MBC3193839.1 hypothetical protein [Pseudonocardia sp. C8]
MSTETRDPNTATDHSEAPESAAAARTAPPEGEGTGGRENGTEATEESGNAEAAGYRRRLREAEAERDRLAEQVTALQRREAERVAAEHLEVGSDLFDVGKAELHDLIDDDGHPDPDRIRTAAATLVGARPGLRRSPSSAEVRAGIGQGSYPSGARPSGASWSEALRTR